MVWPRTEQGEMAAESRHTDLPRRTRGALLRWLGWFTMANAVVLACVGTLFFDHFSLPDSGLALLYLVLVYPAHHVMLAAIPLFLLAGLMILIWPSKPLVVSCAVIVMALVIAIYVLDGLLYSQGHFHLNALTALILGWQSWVFAGVISLMGMVFEFLLAGRVWTWTDSRRKRGGVLVGGVSVVALLSAWFIYAWSEANYFVPVTSLAERLPVYKGFTAKRQLARMGLVDLEAAREKVLARRVSDEFAKGPGRLLDYPASPLTCSNQNRHNLLIIMLDSWRFDMLSETLSPRIFDFARHRGQRFHKHFSGGNGSRAGAFSFFYGLPPGYWSSVEAVQRPAPLVEELGRQGYETAIFSSGALTSPVELDRSAFSGIADLHVSKPADAPPWKRDEMIATAWLKWLQERDRSGPFFSFLFLDGVTGSRPPDDYPVRFEAHGDSELALRFAGYKAATHYVDSLVGAVLDALQQQGLMEQTVILITSDHGTEFNESGMGFDQHGSGFTKFQLQVPLVTAWPGREAGDYHHLTSHYDVTPTLFQDLLGCSNPASDVSVGHNLFDRQDWEWLIVGSYFNHAVIEPDRLTITFPSGTFEVRDWDYELIPDASVHKQVLFEVMSANTRFYAR